MENNKYHRTDVRGNPISMRCEAAVRQLVDNGYPEDILDDLCSSSEYEPDLYAALRFPDRHQSNYRRD